MNKDKRITVPFILSESIINKAMGICGFYKSNNFHLLSYFLIIVLVYILSFLMGEVESRTKRASTEMSSDRSNNKKVIAVIGATRLESMGLVRAIAHEGADGGEFSVRAITNEKPYSDVGKWMRYRGIDMRNVDVDDEFALTKALQGCYGLYAATFYWDYEDPDVELRQARNIAKAAKNAGVRHVIWLTMEDTRSALEHSTAPNLRGKYKVPHFDAKAEADRFFVEAGVPTTYLRVSFLWDYFVSYGMGPRLVPKTGQWEIALPMGKKQLAGIAAEDVGKCALGIFKKPEEFIGKRVGLVADYNSLREIAEKMSAALETPILYRELSADDYRSLNQPRAKEFGNMFEFLHDNDERVAAARSLEQTQSLNPDLMNFDRWLETNKNFIPMRLY